jgi:hypothetical protein
MDHRRLALGQPPPFFFLMGEPSPDEAEPMRPVDSLLQPPSTSEGTARWWHWGAKSFVSLGVTWHGHFVVETREVAQYAINMPWMSFSQFSWLNPSTFICQFVSHKWGCVVPQIMGYIAVLVVFPETSKVCFQLPFISSINARISRYIRIDHVLDVS